MGCRLTLFTSEQARWVGVQVSGQAEQPRVLLVSAPYALKPGCGNRRRTSALSLRAGRAREQQRSGSASDSAATSAPRESAAPLASAAM